MIEDEVIQNLHEGKVYQIIYGEKEDMYLNGIPAWLQIIPAVAIDDDTLRFNYSLMGFIKPGVSHNMETFSSNEALDIMREYGDLDEWQECDYLVNYVERLKGYMQ